MSESDFKPEEGDLVLRDDQADFFAVLDETKNRRARGFRLRVIDSGGLSVLELERLGLSGTELFTSDKAGRTLADLIILTAAAKKGGGLIAHFHHGPLSADSSDAAFPASALREAARLGVLLYLSNKIVPREPADLIVLAEEARFGRCRLGYYHHGPVVPALMELARRGAWIHISADPNDLDPAVPLLSEIAKTAAAEGAGLVIHLEQLIPAPVLEDFYAAGAYLLFRTPPSDYRSPFRILEEKSVRRPLDPRAYYLYSEFMR